MVRRFHVLTASERKIFLTYRASCVQLWQLRLISIDSREYTIRVRKANPSYYRESKKIWTSLFIQRNVKRRRDKELFVKSALDISTITYYIHFYIEATSEKYFNCISESRTRKKYNFTKIKFLTRNNPELSQFPFCSEKLLYKSFE